jgi:hypothetical protein
MSEHSLGLSRRRFLQALSVTTATAAFSGCRHHAYSVLAAGTFAPKQSIAITGDLTIDTHCHIFNGTDIQLRNFMLYTNQGFSPRLINLAQKLELKVGSRGEEEWTDLLVLARLSKCAEAGTTPTCEGGRFVENQAAPLNPEATQPEKARDHIKRMRDKAFRNAKNGIATTIQAHPASTPQEKETDDNLKQMLDAEDHEGFRKKVETAKVKKAAATGGVKPAAPREPTCGDATSLGAELETVVDYFLPRIALAQLYLDIFCPPAGRNVDLMFAAMVDYDWWLANGASTETPLKEQVKVMEQISILSGGRIHGFAPFCPLREVAFRAGYGDEDTGWSSLAFVQDAILKRGCVGVKLYPPMGFAPYGNSELDDPNSPPWDPVELQNCDDPAVHPHPDFWARNTLLPEWARQKKIRYEDGSEERLGIRLDGALGSLYAWCQESEVPILAHTNTTNGVDCVYEKLAKAEYWRKAFAVYPGLRVSFGHMGGLDDALGRQIKIPDTSQAFIDLMGNGSAPVDDAKATYPHAFADSAYDAVLLSCHNQFARRLNLAYQEPVFASRFLYGTDWSLMVHVGRNKLYLKDYEALMNALDTNFHGTGRKPSEDFFGWNAVEYAGLRPTGKSRQRLDTFYARYCMQKPGWAAKVDAG